MLQLKGMECSISSKARSVVPLPHHQVYVPFLRVISQKEDVENLSSTIKSLEETSAHVKDFIKFLKLELPELAHQTEQSELVHPAKKWKPSAKNRKKEEKKEEKVGDKKKEHMAFCPPFPRKERSYIPFPEDYVLNRAFPEWLQTNTSRVSKRGTALSQLPDNSDINSEESEKLEEKEKDESLLLGERKKSFKETGQVVSPNLRNESLKEKGVLVSPNPLHSLPWEVSVVDRLAATIQHAVDQARQKDEDWLMVRPMECNVQ